MNTQDLIIGTLALIGTCAIAAFFAGVAIHCYNPMPTYRRLYRWAGARIAARETFVAAMADKPVIHRVTEEQRAAAEVAREGKMFA